jgi:hypothetical protein
MLVVEEQYRSMQVGLDVGRHGRGPIHGDRSLLHFCSRRYQARTERLIC